MDIQPANQPGPELSLVAINLTQRCNLACKHCYLDADNRERPDPGELTTAEVTALLARLAQRCTETMVVLTGGEPLLRKDLEDIISAGADLGLFMVVGTNGMLLTARRVASLKAAGLAGAGISLDSLDEQRHDRFRGLQGAWMKTMAGIEQCRRQGLPFQLHFSAMTENAHEYPDMVEFAQQAGARVLNVFFLVCTGRGETMTDISPDAYEELLRQIVRSQEHSPGLIVRPRCAPHFKRVAIQENPAASSNLIAGSEGDGCIAGQHYLRITPRGDITACPYIKEPVGNIRHDDFWHTWDTAEQFQALRKPALTGKCGACEYSDLCGGCRARPLALGQDLMAEDTLCTYQPSGDPTIEPLRFVDLSIHWSSEAQTRVARIPGFVRKMVRRRAEAFVSDRGESEVTCEHLDQMISQRFGGSSPPFARPSARPPQPGLSTEVIPDYRDPGDSD